MRLHLGQAPREHATINLLIMGYIKLFRKIKDWEWFDDPNTFALWIHLLIEANWRECETWHGEDLPRGTLITSTSKLSSSTGLTEKQVRNCLDKLVNTGEIIKSGTKKWTRIVICKFVFYQFSQEIEEIELLPKEEETDVEEPKNDEKVTRPGMNKLLMASANRIYALYPTKCPKSGRPTGKSYKDKEKIARMLRDKRTSEEMMSAIIQRYVKDCMEHDSYVKNFSTFLNNLPDYPVDSPGELFAEAPQTPQFQFSDPRAFIDERDGKVYVQGRPGDNIEEILEARERARKEYAEWKLNNERSD